MGGEVIALLSPVPTEHLRYVWEGLQAFAHETLDANSPHSFDELKAKAERDIANGGLSYSALAQDGSFAGAIWFENGGDGICVGHLVFDPRKFSPQEKAEASRDAVKACFAAGYRKIIWQLFADNKRFESFIVKRLGAIHEGTLRQQVRRKGELVDMALYATFPEAA